MSMMMNPVTVTSEASHPHDIHWFAGLAMQAIIARQGAPDSRAAREEIALWSYRMAQAMIAIDQELHASEPVPSPAAASVPCMSPCGIAAP